MIDTDFQFNHLRPSPVDRAIPYFVNYWNTFERAWNVAGPFYSIGEANRIAEHLKVMSNVGKCLVTHV